MTDLHQPRISIDIFLLFALFFLLNSMLCGAWFGELGKGNWDLGVKHNTERVDRKFPSLLLSSRSFADVYGMFLVYIDLF
jgi:hypothetical protein